jgi:hypothetical protein
MDIAGRTELLYEFASGVMIPVNQVNINAGVFQTSHLSIEKQRRFKALKSRVIEVSRNDDEICSFGQSDIEHLLERAPRSVANLVYGSARILSQTLKRRVEMNICAVDEFHLRGLRRRMI